MQTKIGWVQYKLLLLACSPYVTELRHTLAGFDSIGSLVNIELYFSTSICKFDPAMTFVRIVDKTQNTSFFKSPNQRH